MQKDKNFVAESGKWWLYTGFLHSYSSIGMKVMNKKKLSYNIWSWTDRAESFDLGPELLGC